MTFDDRLGSIDEAEAVELATKITLSEFFSEMKESFEEIDNEVTEMFDRVAVWGRAVTLRGLENPELDEDIETIFDRLDHVCAVANNVQITIQDEEGRLP